MTEMVLYHLNNYSKVQTWKDMKNQEAFLLGAGSHALLKQYLKLVQRNNIYMDFICSSYLECLRLLST